MRFWVGLSALFLVLTQAVHGSSRRTEISLDAVYKFVEEPLTTSLVWTLDPGQPNPHLQRWILSRHVEIQDLKAYKKPNNRYGVKASILRSLAQGYIRGPGPWFQPLRDFRCEKQPNRWFYTEEGVKRAVGIAAEIWNDLLEAEKLRLSFILSSVEGRNEASALDQGDKIFRKWLKRVTHLWRLKATSEARLQEWKYYFQESRESGICSQNSKSVFSAPAIQAMMEPLFGQPPKVTQILARAPAKRWNGLFSVRVTLGINNKKLVGQFLVDSGARQSVISPVFLESQGSPFAVLPDASDLPEKINWGGIWKNHTGLARKASVELVELSGYPLPIQDFLVADTEFFNSPQSLGSCCDGVLGADFLKNLVVEFHPGPPSEVRIWPKEGFRWGEDRDWIELSQLDSGELTSSSCVVEQDSKKRGTPSLQLPGILWDTGTEEALNIHFPWQKVVASRPLTPWKLVCDSIPLFTEIPGTLPRGAEGSSLSLKIPAVTAGIPVLAGQGDFTFDLPNGRFWFEKKWVGRAPVAINRSGLTLDFNFINKERVLIVKDIKSNSPAFQLMEQGLKKGSVISQLDSVSSDDLDLWSVNQRLSGVYGKRVTLRWKIKSGYKIAPIDLY